MSSDSAEAGRRIMNHLGEERRIPMLNVSEGDIGILLGFPIAGLFIASLVDSVLVIPLVLIGLTVGVATVYAAPPHLTTWRWLKDVSRHYLRRPTVTLSKPADATHDHSSGGFVQYTPFTPGEPTQELTNIKRAWPGTGAVERTDGVMEAFIEVRPANMDFAMSGDWQSVQAAGEHFANTELRFPLTMYATTRSFPAERLVEQLEDRLDDQDVRTHAAFEQLLEEYRETRPAELAETRQLRYYLGVEVSPIDVYTREDHERTPGEKLSEIPLLGLFVTPFVTRRRDFDAAERRQAMFEKLDERVRTVRTEFIEDVAGWSATNLSTLELFVLATEFWNGEEYDGDTERLLRREPLLDNTNRGDEQ